MHLESLERQTRERPPQLDGPECPRGFEHLWEYFIELSAEERRSGLSGIEPLHSAEIDAWMRLNHRDLGFFEIECIRLLDRKYREINAPKKQ